MSHEAMQRVYDYSKAKSNARLVLLSIAFHTNEQGFSFPGLDLLSKEVGIGKEYVSKHLQALEAAGEIFKKKGGGRGRSNRYIILLGHTVETLRPILAKLGELSQLKKLSPFLLNCRPKATEKKEKSRPKPAKLSPHGAGSNMNLESNLNNIDAHAPAHEGDLVKAALALAEDYNVLAWRKTDRHIQESMIIDFVEYRGPNFCLQQWRDTLISCFSNGVKNENLHVRFQVYDSGGDYPAWYRANNKRSPNGSNHEKGRGRSQQVSSSQSGHEDYLQENKSRPRIQLSGLRRGGLPAA